MFSLKKNYSLLITLIVLGLILFLIQAHACQENTFWYNAVGNTASALLVGGTLSLLHEILLRDERDKDIQKLFGIAVSIKESGLENIYTDSSKYDYSDIIRDAETFCAIMNDGLRWVGNYSTKLEARFDKVHTVTEFYLVNPESDFCKALANKTSVETPALKTKINQTVDLLISTFNKSKKRGNLRIYYLKNYPTQSLFYSDKKVVVTPYQTSSGRSIIPLYEYSFISQKESIGSHLDEDLNRVRAESIKIWDNNTGS